MLEELAEVLDALPGAPGSCNRTLSVRHKATDIERKVS